MSIRNIGQDIYVPYSPGNFARGQTKVMRVSTLPDQHDQKKNKTSWYKEELDRQVQETKKRKQDQKKREQEEDERRERQFYNSLNNVQVNSISQNVSRKLQYSNPEETDDYEDNYHYESSRLAHVGKRKLRVDIPIFENKADLIDDRNIQIEYSGLSLDRRRKQFNEDIDRNLREAFVAIERSKQAVDINQELSKFRRRLKTEPDAALEDSRNIHRYDNYESDRFYTLPNGGRGHKYSQSHVSHNRHNYM